MTSQTLKDDIVKINGFTFENLKIAGWENVYKITNEKKKLLAVIAIHNTKLGTALGGTRIRNYSSFEEGLEDVLRLSEGMTYKSAISEVGFGGGKSVIFLKDEKDKTEDLLEAYGEAVNILNGKYICAEDMGCTTKDVMVIKRKTKFIVGLPHEKSSGDPGRFTAWGIIKGMQATLKKLYGTDDFTNRKIAIQGLGNVGEFLIDQLFFLGADLIITDINNEKLQKLSRIYSAKAVKPDEIYSQECDIFSPCAMGGILNEKTINQLRCKSVCGSANNQLLKREDGDLLKAKNILYSPDFVINAGGLINVSIELEKNGYCAKRSKAKIDKIYDEILKIYEISEKNGISTNDAAIKLALNKIESGIGIKQDKLYFHHSG